MFAETESACRSNIDNRDNGMSFKALVGTNVSIGMDKSEAVVLCTSFAGVITCDSSSSSTNIDPALCMTRTK